MHWQFRTLDTRQRRKREIPCFFSKFISAREGQPHAIELLVTMGYETSEFRSKSWNEFADPDAPKMDFVFTVCDSAANEICPVWPGHPMSAHWGVPDPAAVEGTDAEKRLAFAEAFRMLRNRISIFVNLPAQSLDRMSLQRRLDEIGASLPDTA